MQQHESEGGMALSEEDVWAVISRSQQLEPGAGQSSAAGRASLSHEEVILNGCGDEDPKRGRSGEGSWIDIAQVIWSSLRVSFQHIDTLGLDTVAFGCMALAKKHATQDYMLLGQAVDEVAERLLWLQQVQWCLSIYQAPESRELLADKLGLEPSHILSYEPTSFPLCPAYFLAVDHPGRTVALVIRGTSQLHDLVADVCGHCVPFFGGYAHCGMLTASQRILSVQMDYLEAACRKFPGYRINIIGHSLGGGIAALMAVTLVNSPELQQRLGRNAVPLITATSFGAPPVMTLELAQACTAYVTSVVLENDVIARLSVESLRILSQEMAVCKEEVIGASGLLSWARDSAALSVSRDLVAQMCRVYAAQKVHAVAGAVTRSPTMGAVLAAGLAWAGGSMANRASSISSGGPSPAPSASACAPQAPSAASASAPAAAAGPGPNLSGQLASAAASALWSWGSRARDRVAQRGPVPEHSLTSLACPPPSPPSAPQQPQPSSAPGSSSASVATLLGHALSAWQAASNSAASNHSNPGPSNSGVGTLSQPAARNLPAGPGARVSFSSSLAASMAAAAVAAASAALATPSASAPAPSSASKYSLLSTPEPPAMSFTSNPLGAHPPSAPAPAPGASGSSRSAPNLAGLGSQGEAEPAPQPQLQHPLHTAGQMYLIKRPAAAAATPDPSPCTYVLRGNPGPQAHRLLIKKSMLQDHYLKEYQNAISNSF